MTAWQGEPTLANRIDEIVGRSRRTPVRVLGRPVTQVGIYYDRSNLNRDWFLKIASRRNTFGGVIAQESS